MIDQLVKASLIVLSALRKLALAELHQIYARIEANSAVDASLAATKSKVEGLVDSAQAKRFAAAFEMLLRLAEQRTDAGPGHDDADLLKQLAEGLAKPETQEAMRKIAGNLWHSLRGGKPDTYAVDPDRPEPK